MCLIGRGCDTGSGMRLKLGRRDEERGKLKAYATTAGYASLSRSTLRRIPGSGEITQNRVVATPSGEASDMPGGWAPSMLLLLRPGETNNRLRDQHVLVGRQVPDRADVQRHAQRLRVPADTPCSASTGASARSANSFCSCARSRNLPMSAMPLTPLREANATLRTAATRRMCLHTGRYVTSCVDAGRRSVAPADSTP